MDAFEIRLQFLNILRKLSSSQSSISRVVSFAIKHSNKCADDLWEVLGEECGKANLNARINIFYCLDNLLETSYANGIAVYVDLIKRDLAKMVDLVVPEGQEGILNAMSSLQILKSWKTKRVLEAEVIEPIEAEIERRKASRPAADEQQGQHRSSSGFANFSRNDIFRRIEDDRERHKRLRERIWVLPAPASVIPLARPASLLPGISASPVSPATDVASIGAKVLEPSADSVAIDIEFDQLYEALRPLTEGEIQLMKAESARCFGEVAA